MSLSISNLYYNQLLQQYSTTTDTSSVTSSTDDSVFDSSTLIEDDTFVDSSDSDSWENTLFQGTLSSDYLKDDETTYTTTSSGSSGAVQTNALANAQKLVEEGITDATAPSKIGSPAGVAWCAYFVNYCYKQAYGGEVPWGESTGLVSDLLAWGQKEGLFVRKEKITNPQTQVQPGDIIIFKDNGASHTGIVESVSSDGTINTIEGNTDDKCARRHYSIDNSRISGIIQMSRWSG